MFTLEMKDARAAVAPRHPGAVPQEGAGTGRDPCRHTIYVSLVVMTRQPGDR